MRLNRRLLASSAALLLSLCRMPGAAAAEEQTIKAFSAFEAEGQVMTTGPNEATYVGLLSGPLYIENDQGPMNAGALVCPLVLHINLRTKTEQGSGQCAITGPAGNQAYISLTCAGVPLVGCNGASTITGGTGRFANATGGETSFCARPCMSSRPRRVSRPRRRPPGSFSGVSCTTDFPERAADRDECRFAEGSRDLKRHP